MGKKCSKCPDSAVNKIAYNSPKIHVGSTAKLEYNLNFDGHTRVVVGPLTGNTYLISKSLNKMFVCDKRDVPAFLIQTLKNKKIYTLIEVIEEEKQTRKKKPRKKIVSKDEDSEMGSNAEPKDSE